MVKVQEINRRLINEEYPEEVVDILLEAADAPKSEPMSADELLESLDLGEE